MIKNLPVEEIEKLTVYWKEKLGLQDWTIAIKICRESEMKLKNVSGENEYMHQIKTAFISILDVIDYGDRIIPQDQEKTLVHELLHCLFSSIDTEEIVQDRIQHQIINTIANALVDAKREGINNAV